MGNTIFTNVNGPKNTKNTTVKKYKQNTVSSHYMDRKIEKLRNNFEFVKP